MRRAKLAPHCPWSSLGRSINQLQRELDLPRGACRLADNSEAGATNNVGRQSEIHDVEDIEEFGAKFEHCQLALGPASERGVLDQRHIKITIAWPTKGVATQRAKTAMIRPGSCGNIDGNEKKRAIVGAQAEIIFAGLTAG